jgi:hypothetical protein
LLSEFGQSVASVPDTNGKGAPSCGRHSVAGWSRAGAHGSNGLGSGESFDDWRSEHFEGNLKLSVSST